jgi:hypothetical protein
MKKKKDMITAEEFDKKFDAGEDISVDLDWSKATRPKLDQRRVNLDLPIWMIDSLDSEARRVGVTRQSIMKVWLSERIKTEHKVSQPPKSSMLHNPRTSKIVESRLSSASAARLLKSN